MNTEVQEPRLVHWPVPCESLTVPTRYGNTHVIASGPRDATPLVLLSALGVTSRMWLPNIAALSREHRTYAVDTIGDRGGSMLHDRARYPRVGQAYSEWLVDLYDAIGIEQACILGASYGGWIAMNHAIHAPGYVRRLVLLGPMGLPSWWTTLKVLARLWSAFLFPTQSTIDRIIQWALGEDASVRAAFAPLMAMGARGFSEFRLPPPLPVPNDRLQKIVSPTLLMLGECDNVIGNARDVATRARRWIPHLDVKIIPGTGHMMNTECAEFVNRCILSFLEERKEYQI